VAVSPRIIARQLRLAEVREELARRDWTVPDLADWIGVSGQTLRRDLREIGARSYCVGSHQRWYTLRRAPVGGTDGRIVSLLAEGPRRNADIARTLGADRRTTLYALRRLEVAGLALRKPGGKGHWTITGETR
jgi:DNA-binding IclR family transcriptional regulator